MKSFLKIEYSISAIKWMSTVRNHYLCAMTIITHSGKSYQRILSHEEDPCIYSDILNENGRN